MLFNKSKSHHERTYSKGKFSLSLFALAVFLFLIPGILPVTFARSALPTAITKQNSVDFAGYIIQASTVNTITLFRGTDAVPKVTCAPSETDHAAYDPSIQADAVGILFGCSSGSPSYGAWCEIVGVEFCPGISVSDIVSPGDKMKSVITLSYSTHMATIKLMDTTKSWSYTYSFSDTEAVIDAYWVLQSFSSTLPNFGTMKTTSNLATIGTHHATIKSFSSKDSIFRDTLVDSTMHTMASTGSLSSSGSGFSIKWVSST